MFSPPPVLQKLKLWLSDADPSTSHASFPVILVGVYIPPQANARTAINNLAASITATENAKQDSIVLALNDFSHTKLRKALAKYKQHVKCPTSDDKTLDHCYCTIPDAFHAVPRAPLSRSDHAMVNLIPTYFLSSSLTNLSKRLKRNGPKMPFYIISDVLIVLTGPCSASPVPTKMSMHTRLPPMPVSVQTPASPQRLSQSVQMTNPSSQRTSNTNSLQKMMLSRTVIKTSTKQLNIKLRRLSEEQKHSTEISLKNSSQHPTAMLCGMASSKSPSINRN